MLSAPSLFGRGSALQHLLFVPLACLSHSCIQESEVASCMSTSFFVCRMYHGGVAIVKLALFRLSERNEGVIVELGRVHLKLVSS